MAVNETYKLSVVGSYRGQDIVHTLHFREVVFPGPGTFEQRIIDQWQANCRTSWVAQYGTGYIMSKLRAEKVCGTLPLPVAVEETDTTPGTRGGVGDQPPWLACRIKENGVSAGRSRQGRFFVMVSFESDQDAGVIGAGTITLFQNYVNTLSRWLALGADAAEARLVVHSRKLAAVPGAQCQDSSTLVGSYTVGTFLTTMRSRRSRTGA